MKRCSSYEGYSADMLGNIYSHRFRVRKSEPPYKWHGIIDYSKHKLLTPYTGKKGHQLVTLFINSKRIYLGVHVLVADAFNGARPKGLMVRHLDDNPLNNHPSNLAYGTYQDNADDRKRNKGYASGVDCSWAKLNIEQVKEIREMANAGMTKADISKHFPVTVDTVSRIIRNKSYKLNQAA